MAKKKWAIDMGKYLATDKEIEANNWCLRNKIFISPRASDSSHWRIDININGRVSSSPRLYEKTEIWQKLYEFSVYYYEKYKKELGIPVS